eukprot:3210457-Pyramimonas_sp.AAC.1
MRPPTQDSVSWPHWELHLRPPWRCSHASPPPWKTFRGPTWNSTWVERPAELRSPGWHTAKQAPPRGL